MPSAEFDPSRALKAATGRAKSDVANKLVSMFLHEISRKACSAGGLSVSDQKYCDAVAQSFGRTCLYCGVILEKDRISVEHLEGMNRFRAGLHVPGNVGVSCRDCNREKRRDDQNPDLSQDGSGWRSFLSHDGTNCPEACKTCFYWATVFPDQSERARRMVLATEKIVEFQRQFSRFVTWSLRTRPLICDRIETLYRDCQDFASQEIIRLTKELNVDFSSLSCR